MLARFCVKWLQDRYNLSRPALHALSIDSRISSYHLWLKNRQALYGVENLVIAPGYNKNEEE